MDHLHRLTFEEIAAERTRTEQQYGSHRHPVGVLLWNVRSAYNVGSIFRTCDATRVERLILSGYTPSPVGSGVHKTSLGAEQSVPWEHIPDPLEAIQRMRSGGHRIIAVELVKDARCYAALHRDDFPATFVFGNELIGIDEKILSACDDAVMIPMYGVKHSLNVAISVGIVLYRALETLGVIVPEGLAARHISR